MCKADDFFFWQQEKEEDKDKSDKPEDGKN